MKTLCFDALVIGSGCAGYNCADHLWDLGVKNVAVITEDRLCGTSRNTGSDKQTYYKLSLAGDAPDSVTAMARTLFDGGAVDGDIALSEAAGSARGFLKLAGLGVPFPTNEYGEFAGYRTDHDPACRAASIGPYTSRKMTEVLEASVMRKGIPILDHMQVIRILKKGNACVGVLALELSRKDDPQFVAVRAPAVVLATGGPAYLYKNSVYPACHTGASALALFAGATFHNLSEWQYGLASVDFRWNVSGSYQQVLPRYISVDENGTEREFLTAYFSSPEEMLKNVFLKGYEWPFDVRRIGGSSIIDLLVCRESVILGRSVYLDFRSDPAGIGKNLEGLDETARDYLKKSGALIAGPVNRLRAMNPGALALYAEHGIDLEKQPLRIAVCAQHNNGGVGVDRHWQTDVPGLYAAGEAAGTFGIFRPGGSALNSTQVGSLRAAEHIRYHALGRVPEDFDTLAGEEAERLESWALQMKGSASTLLDMRELYQSEMSHSFGFLRVPGEMDRSLRRLKAWDASFTRDNRWAAPAELGTLYKNRELLSMAIAAAEAMIFAAEKYGSRGSALVSESDGLIPPSPRPEKTQGRGEVLLTRMDEKGGILCSSRPVRPLPERDLWFETVWKNYREEREKKDIFE